MPSAYSGCTAGGAVRAYTPAGGGVEGERRKGTWVLQMAAIALASAGVALPCTASVSQIAHTAAHPPAHAAAGPSRQAASSARPSCGRQASASASAFGWSSDTGPVGGGAAAADEKAYSRGEGGLERVLGWSSDTGQVGGGAAAGGGKACGAGRRQGSRGWLARVEEGCVHCQRCLCHTASVSNYERRSH